MKTSRIILAALYATAICAATIADAAVKSSVFDDVKVWYRGALAAESYYSNGPEGTFANNGGSHPSKSFKSITCASDSDNALNNLAWSWGWGAETTLDSAPVVCPLTQFRFFVPENMGKFRGVFTTRAQNTGGSTFNWEFLANGTSFGTYGLKGGNEYEIKVPVENIVAGWNTLAWKRVSGWVNYDWHKFTLVPAPQPLVFVVH